METELQAHFYLVLLLWQSIPSNWVGPSIICNVCIVYRHTMCVCITSNTLSIAWRYPWKRTLIILYRSSSWMNVKSKEHKLSHVQMWISVFVESWDTCLHLSVLLNGTWRIWETQRPQMTLTGTYSGRILLLMQSYEAMKKSLSTFRWECFSPWTWPW